MKSLLAPLLLLTAIPVFAQTSVSSGGSSLDHTLVSISSQAESTRVPDVANISAKVVTQNSNSNAALRANAAQTQQVMAAIKKAGIAERDVQTSGVNLNPQYKYEDNQPAKIVGYEAANSVEIKVRDINRLGQLLDELSASGANAINGPSFSIDNPEPLYDEARLDALRKAKARAELYAKSLGVRVIRIVSIDENNTGGIRPMVTMAAPMSKAAYSPIAPGESTVSVTLNIVFELGL